MEYKSQFWNVKIRPAILKEFTYPSGKVDDMMAGLHEIRVRCQEKAKKEKSRSRVKPASRKAQV